MEDKKKFVIPEVEIISFNSEDIILTSNEEVIGGKDYPDDF